MTKFEIYRLLHFAGIFTLLYSFGSLFIGGNYNKRAAIGHGAGILLILVGGFGMQATMHLGFPVWLILKIVILAIFGGFIVLSKRKLVSGFTAWLLIMALALGAVHLAKTKPAFAKKSFREKVTERIGM